MGLLFKLLLFFGILYFGFRMITKPFRDYVKAAKRQQSMNGQTNQQKKEESTTKTENLGEYIDYEEVE